MPYELAPGRTGEAIITLRQPWASAVLLAGKDVENRTWRTNYRGRLWIHAGTATARGEFDLWAEERDLWIPAEPLPRGVILGHVDLIDVVQDSDSPWALPDHFHWILRRPMLLSRPISRTGERGLRYIRPPQGRVERPPARRRSRRTSR